jgi:lipase
VEDDEPVTTATEPSEHRVRANGIELAYFEWGSAHRDDGPSLLFVHATGFHARCWDPVIARLGRRHVISVDQRGHGRSEKLEITDWEDLGRDLVELVRALDLRDVIGVGHSMGGHALVDAAASYPEPFRRLVLIDPVIASPTLYNEGGWKISGLGAEPHPTTKRKRHFESPEAMIARFEDREPYRVFHPDALRAYCTHGLLPAREGDGFDLACPPEVEASVYMTSRTHSSVYESVRAIELPVLILRAKLPPKDRSLMDFSSSPTWPGLVNEFAQGREIHFAEHTHFLPMEIPQRVAEEVLAEIEAEVGAPD